MTRVPQYMLPIDDHDYGHVFLLCLINCFSSPVEIGSVGMGSLSLFRSLCFGVILCKLALMCSMAM